MFRIPEPILITKRNDSKTFQFPINYDCELYESVCAQWRRKSFKDLPDELAMYRYPKTRPAAKAGVNVLIAYLRNKQEKAAPSAFLYKKNL